MKKISIDQNFNGNKAAKAIYGIILIAVMLVGLHHAHQGIIHILGTLLIGGLTIVFAEIYSEIIGETIANKGPLPKNVKKKIKRDIYVISTVSIYPFFLFLLAYFNIISEDIAFKVSFAGLLLGLSFFGYVASFASGKSRYVSITQGLITGAIGLIIIFLKYIFTH